MPLTSVQHQVLAATPAPRTGHGRCGDRLSSWCLTVKLSNRPGAIKRRGRTLSFAPAARNHQPCTLPANECQESLRHSRQPHFGVAHIAETPLCDQETLVNEHPNPLSEEHVREAWHM